MKKRLLLFLFLLVGWAGLRAQLPNGATAPDFTVTDLNGVTHNLYDLLDAGKTVYLDFSATWCGPCWNYHNTHALRDIWEDYGPPGTDEAFVIFIESDPATNTACLYGPSGCVGGTQGDWVTGTPYPIVDDASVAGQYAIAYYPTIYMVCPQDKKVYLAGQLPATGLWNLRSQKCVTPALQVSVNSVQNVKCYNTSTGRINISVAGGNPPYTYSWSNGANTQNLVNIPEGTYECTITSSNGWIGETGPIDVFGPASPLTVELIEFSPVGCNGVLGSISVGAQGGWDNSYQYHWSNGFQGETVYNLQAGNYTVTATDAEGCTTTLTHSLAPAVLPVATAVTPGPVTCAFPNRTLNGEGSSVGPEFSYQWFASNGGNIVSGDKTLNPVVNAGGAYTLRVTNNDNNCQTFFALTQPADQIAPSADAGPSGFVTCVDTIAELEGSGSAGQEILYDWVPFNGGHIASGDSTLNPVVDAAGSYALVVYNTLNGCLTADTTHVTGSNRPPSIAVSNDPITCDTQIVTLKTITNAGNPVFEWTGPNGFNSNEQSPQVDLAGDYILTIHDTLTFCVNTDTITVKEDKEPPGAMAIGGDLTCIAQSVTLNASTQDTLVSYAWSGPNGFASTEQNPVVNEPGEYTVVITAADNGCTSSAIANVNLVTAPPAAAAATPGTLNCDHNELILDGSGSEQGSHISYQWSTSNGNIISGAESANPVIDASGDYTILVTNSQTGCTNTASVTVIQRTPVAASVNGITSLNCFGDADGAATAGANGGDGTYSYLWSNGQTEADVENLTAGNYTVVITDGEGCSASASLTITQPTALLVIGSATGQSANGVNDGTASVQVQGGVPGYTYEWSNGETTASISNLAPGTYTVIVTDQNGCTKSQSVTVNAFDCLLSATVEIGNVACAGASTGSVTLNLNGGNAPFSYTWSNGATTEHLSDVPAGTYGVTIEDDAGCETTQIATITEPAPMTFSAVQTENATCENDTDGAASVAVQGGVGSYTYVWSNGEQTPSINNLAPGVYTVTVMDGNSCTATQSVTIQAVDDIAPEIEGGANAVVPIAANGTGNVTLADLNITLTDNCAGAVSVQFTPANFTCAEVGTQTVTLIATDLSGNTALRSISVEVVDQIAPVLTCPPSIQVCPADNTVEYAAPVATDNCLGNGVFALASGLPSGSEFPVGVTTQQYTFTDAGGNVGSCSFDVEVSEPAEIQVDEVIDDVNSQGIGAISVTVEGAGPFTYTWEQDGVTVGNTEDLVNLSSGLYLLRIVDANGCEFAGTTIEVGNLSGTQEPEWMTGVQVRPNPANEQVQIQFIASLPSDLALSIVDATGRILIEQHFSNQIQASLQTAQLPEGMYFLKMRSGSETGVRKLMIRH